MSYLAGIASWISSNEQLLSGLAAMIVVAGVLFSPLGGWIRQRVRGSAARGEATPGTSTDVPGPPAPDERAARLTYQALTRPAPAAIRFARSDGLRIAWNERGTAPPAILMAPGIVSHLHMTSNLPSTRATLEALGRFARVVAFDKRGQGLSDPTLSVPDLEERTRDIGAVMDAAGLDRAVLLGFSEGGPMCLRFAFANPDRVQGLVIVGSTACWVQSEGFPIGLPRRAIEGLAEAWGTGALRDVFFPNLSREQVDDDTYRAFERLIANRTAIRQLTAMMVETDVRPLLPEIHTPALVVHFSGDLAVPVRLGRALAEGLPNAEFLEVQGADHGDLSQAPEAIERIRTFCERVARDAERAG